MRSLIIIFLSVLAAVSVSAAPFAQKGWISRRDLDIHIEWPGSGGSDENHAAGRWPLSGLFSGPRRWPFSDHYSKSAPTPTLKHQKRSYLHHEHKAASTGTCDLQSAVNYMDLSAVSPALPPVASDLSLFQVAIGRGTQNYTCDVANATATPVALGAVATLFNFSCVAAQQPALLKKLPQIALNQPIPTENNTDAKILENLTSGHHYFVSSTTPFFNMDTAAHQYGMGAVAKTNASNAPSDAIAGQHGTTGYGAVQWLYLTQTQYAEENWKAVYRVNTAGGNAPKTCAGQPAAFEIEYAAEYWLFT